MTPRRHGNGFTLVEVLASLGLVAVILPTVMAGISLAMGLAESARLKTEATALASTRLNEIVAGKEWLEGDAEGDFGEDWPRYSWRQEVSDWEDAALKEVRVNVIWTWRGQERSVAISTLVYAGGV